jgi:hypothetical protein
LSRASPENLVASAAGEVMQHLPPRAAHALRLPWRSSEKPDATSPVK